MMSLNPTPIWDGYGRGVPRRSVDLVKAGGLYRGFTRIGADQEKQTLHHWYALMTLICEKYVWDGSGMRSSKPFGILIKGKGEGC